MARPLNFRRDLAWSSRPIVAALRDRRDLLSASTSTPAVRGGHAPPQNSKQQSNSDGASSTVDAIAAECEKPLWTSKPQLFGAFDLVGGGPYKRRTQIESRCGRAAPSQGAGGHMCLCHEFRAGAVISGQKWSWSGETDLSAEPACAQAEARVPQAHGHTGRRACDRSPPSQGAQAPLCLTSGCQQGRRRRQHTHIRLPV